MKSRSLFFMASSMAFSKITILLAQAVYGYEQMMWNYHEQISWTLQGKSSYKTFSQCLFTLHFIAAHPDILTKVHLKNGKSFSLLQLQHFNEIHQKRERKTEMSSSLESFNFMITLGTMSRNEHHSTLLQNNMQCNGTKWTFFLISKFKFYTIFHLVCYIN